jgi:acyl dehydratase
MSYTQTTKLDLDKAVPGSNQPFETASINSNWDKVDAEAIAIDARLDTAETDITALEAGTTIVKIDGGNA